jgi:APA family basic amino acid/polyamine antiporter
MRKKSIASIVAETNNHSESEGFKKTLTALNLTLIGIGGVIGAGIFVLTGQAASHYAGPGIVISFILSGIGCAFAALCYAELAAMIPASGSAYSYSYATLGEFIAWIIGWDLILEYLFGSATVAVGWSGYVVSFFKDIGLPFPEQFSKAPLNYIPGEGWVSTGAYLNLPAVFIVMVATYFLVRGIKESASFNNLVVFIKVAVILAFVACGFAYVNYENWTPFIPENTGEFGIYGWSGVFRGAAVIFFAYIGFDAVSTLAQEAKNPQRDMPIGILATLFVCTILYILVAAVMTGIVPYKQLNDPAPIAVAVNMAGEGLMWLRPFIKLGAIAGLSSVVLVLLMSQPRIFYAMSKDGLLPPIFSKMHPRFGTPHVSSIIVGVIAMIVAGFFPIGILGELVSIGTLLAFVLVCGGVWILRRTEPNAPRAFKTPWVPLVPILGILVSLSQMAALPLDTWFRLIIWMAIGFIIYFAYGRKNSVVGKSQS